MVFLMLLYWDCKAVLSLDDTSPQFESFSDVIKPFQVLGYFLALGRFHIIQPNMKYFLDVIVNLTLPISLAFYILDSMQSLQAIVFQCLAKDK